MGFTKQQLSLCEGARIPDLIGDGCRLLFVGINPGLQTAMTGIHFAHPSNRFWPALQRAGIIEWVPDVSPATPSVTLESIGSPMTDPGSHGQVSSSLSYPMLTALLARSVDDEMGMTAAQREDFVERGIGITNLVNRATARASELDRDELRSGGDRLARFVARVRPRVVAVAGVTAFRDAFGQRGAGLGRQPSDLSGAQLWVVPNPSGLNAHETTASLADWYRRVAEAADL